MSAIRVATFDGPGASAVIRDVARPRVSAKAALVKNGTCGVSATDVHILDGRWATALPWPLTLGHEIAGIITEIGAEFTEDYMGNTLKAGSKVLIPSLMPCGRCAVCTHDPGHANRCMAPIGYGRTLGFDRPPHLWGGFAEMSYVDFDMFSGTRLYKLPDDMPLWLGSLVEPLTVCIRGWKRAQDIGLFAVGDTVVIQGSGPIGMLAIVAAREMGAGRVAVIGTPEEPRLRLCRQFGAEATIDIALHPSPEERIEIVRETVGGTGADVVMDCTGDASAGPEGIEMLRDGGTYIEMGQAADARAIATNWHRFCAKDISILGSWAYGAEDVARSIALLDRVRGRYPFGRMQTRFGLSEQGIADAIAMARSMRGGKATIVPDPEIVD